MPLLMCPNDDSPMQTMDRAGVQFDMCPTCRGVWLDRGELEKLMESATAEGRASVAGSVAGSMAAPPQPHFQQSQSSASSQPWGATGYRDDRHRDQPRHDDRYRSGDGHYKKKKRDSIFDIFD